MGNKTWYLQALDHRQDLRHRLEEITILTNEQRRVHRQERSVESMEGLRRLRFQRRELRFQFHDINTTLDEHKNKMAEIASQVTDEMAYDDESSGEWIGEARWDACHEVSSPEWLKRAITTINRASRL